ncbi:thioredoxin domain-containing protein [Bdellovibrio sp. SKB1291214]|uniref:DsbA family protein n=1 Tax=Bdellovibrio sp. SKB1291214 TaxID=1732569 RepID=UPI0020CD71B5|nr:thioredoxin domain-containing protein [Bdellovibrio sp. SKB1291214]UYL09017.1 thioredoxin domain-containing protein [Bdellovibrio sp. SKB1291214]
MRFNKIPFMEATLKAIKLAAVSALALSLVNCAPSAKQLKEAVEKDPSIVFAAIEKDPEQFIEVVNKAAQGAQKKAQEKAMAEEGKKRDEEFANPLKANIEDGRVVFGPKDAKVTIVEYTDFECPYCAKGHATVAEVMKAYPKDVKVVLKHLPLDFHPMAMPAARYFEAIAMQDHAKAEKFYNMVFENQGELRTKKEGFLKDTAKKVGADMKRVEADLKSEKITKQIEADMEEAKKFNFSGTPGFLINGVSLRGAYPFPEFKDIIDRHLKTAAK